ncbi:helix-turn-helix transcriptional regulator [Roseobacter litoralis]|nr:helix-turn-helix domain-containing protein [Roseobacter litoralis]
MTDIELSEEIRALRETVDQMAEQLARVEPNEKLMTTPECAEFLGVGKDVMFEWRKNGEGPPYLHMTARTIRYDRDDVLAWARSHRVN